MNPTISVEERDVLYSRIVVRLNGIDSVHLAIDEENWDAAHRLAQEFSDLLHLLWADLGWGERAEESLSLSTPHDVMTRALSSLRELARSDRAHDEEERQSAQERVDEALYIEGICGRLIGDNLDRD